ncbi:hypothetical protein ACRE1S_04495 [Helicobacter himalayensis]|uniref:hypothetical protein n=1 Tax=Helicobacter himalayensis TaxID=1591088 RepID=UPI003D6F24DD
MIFGNPTQILADAQESCKPESCALEFFALLKRVVVRFENNPYVFVGINAQNSRALQECKQKVAQGLRVQKCILIELESQKVREVLAQAFKMEEFFTTYKITLTFFLRANLAQFSSQKLPSFLRLCVLRA